MIRESIRPPSSTACSGEDPDISIRKRALDVTYSLVDEANIKSMTKAASSSCLPWTSLDITGLLGSKYDEVPMKVGESPKIMGKYFLGTWKA